MLGGSALWEYFVLYESTMEAADMDTLLYCLITAPYVQESGFDGYAFVTMSGLNGTLNPYVIQKMVEKAPQPIGYVLDDVATLSAAEQT